MLVHTIGNARVIIGVKCVTIVQRYDKSIIYTIIK